MLDEILVHTEFIDEAIGYSERSLGLNILLTHDLLLIYNLLSIDTVESSPIQRVFQYKKS